MRDVLALKRLKVLLERLDKRENVSKRDLKLCLTTKQVRAWEEDEKWVEEEANACADQYKDRPTEFNEYLDLVKKANFAYYKVDHLSSKRGKALTPGVSNLKGIADTLYEKALERLEEILEADRSLEVWLDRPVDFSEENYPSLEPESMPRLKTSKSSYAQSTYKSNKREQIHLVRRRAVVEAIKEIEDEIGGAGEPDTSNAPASNDQLKFNLKRLSEFTGRKYLSERLTSVSNTDEASDAQSSSDSGEVENQPPPTTTQTPKKLSRSPKELLEMVRKGQANRPKT
jgi:hypothetical protein